MKFLFFLIIAGFSLLSHCLFIVISLCISSGNVSTIIVLSVKNLPYWNQQFWFLYFRHVLVWAWIWNVLTKSNKLGSCLKLGRLVQIVLSRQEIYSSFVSRDRVGPFKIHINERMWLLLHNSLSSLEIHQELQLEK